MADPSEPQNDPPSPKRRREGKEPIGSSQDPPLSHFSPTDDNKLIGDLWEARDRIQLLNSQLFKLGSDLCMPLNRIIDNSLEVITAALVKDSTTRSREAELEDFRKCWFLSGSQAIADFIESPIFRSLLSQNFDAGFKACKRLGIEKGPCVDWSAYSMAEARRRFM